MRLVRPLAPYVAPVVALSLAGAVAVLATLPARAQTCPDPTPTAVDVGSVPIVVTSTTDDYFVLYVTHDVDGTEAELPVLVKVGEAGTTTLAENVTARPKERYRVEKYLVAHPADVDGDCIDDLTELNELGAKNPVNPAAAIELGDGTVTITDHATFETLSNTLSSRLKDTVKFFMVNVSKAGNKAHRPATVYFMNTKTHPGHKSFARDVLGIEPYIGGGIRGQLGYGPELTAPDGSLGAYYFSTFRYGYTFSQIERAYTLLAAGMPLLKDNLVYWIPGEDLREHQSLPTAVRAIPHQPRVRQGPLWQYELSRLERGNEFRPAPEERGGRPPPPPGDRALRGVAQRAAPNSRHHLHCAADAVVTRQPPRRPGRHSQRVHPRRPGRTCHNVPSW